jgi:MFS family permease
MGVFLLKTDGKVLFLMNVSSRIYLDAALQNIKSVTFFTFLPVLIARLGASNFEIALSNSLPPIFCAISLAFLTRQLPVTKGIFLYSGYIRQFAFLSMALCILLPNPIPYLLFFWSVNAVSVMVTGAQQPAIMRKHVEPSRFPRIFSVNKMIGITIVTIGSMGIGIALDATDLFFPMNYVVSMLIGCLATFAGMSLIAELAPVVKQKIRLTWVRPFQECDRTIWWMGLNNIGISMVGPLYTIYHVKMLQLSNTQIAYFVLMSGILSAVMIPLARRWMERYSVKRIYTIAVLGMAVTILPYGFIETFWVLVLVQGWVGVCLSVHEVASQSMMMEEAAKHKKEMAYFSDFHLVMNAGNGIGALIAGALVFFLPVWGCFILVAVARLLFLASIKLRSSEKSLNSKTRESSVPL